MKFMRLLVLYLATGIFLIFSISKVFAAEKVVTYEVTINNYRAEPDKGFIPLITELKYDDAFVIIQTEELKSEGGHPYAGTKVVYTKTKVELIPEGDLGLEAIYIGGEFTFNVSLEYEEAAVTKWTNVTALKDNLTCEDLHKKLKGAENLRDEKQKLLKILSDEISKLNKKT